jgi:hypothetical protein
MTAYKRSDDVDAIADRMASRLERRRLRDELHLGRGLRARRLKNLDGHATLERAFAREWMKERSILCHLLRPYPHANTKYKDMTPEDWVTFDRPVFVTKRDSEVAATIIQWLGTNVGFSFLQHVLHTCGYEVRRRDSRKLRTEASGATGQPAEVCGARCDHGSECLALPGHAGGHETQHGCIFYDAPREQADHA